MNVEFTDKMRLIIAGMRLESFNRKIQAWTSVPVSRGHGVELHAWNTVVTTGGVSSLRKTMRANDAGEGNSESEEDESAATPNKATGRNKAKQVDTKSESAPRAPELGPSWQGEPNELAGAPEPAGASQSDTCDGGASQSDAHHGAEESAPPKSTYPVGARIAYMFSHDNWYEGTVMRVPWLRGHRWEHWRRVQFDDGDTRVVDTTRNCAVTDGRAAVVEARDFLKTIKYSKSQTVRVSSKKSRAGHQNNPPGKGKGKGKGKGRGKGKAEAGAKFAFEGQISVSY